MDRPHKNKRPRRRAYLDDFARTASGEYVYTGVTYAFQGREAQRRRCLFFFGLLAAGMAAAAVICGCISVPGLDRCAYVLLPYTASLAATVSLVWAFGRLAAGGEPLRAYVYRATVAQFPLRTALTIAAAALALGGEALYLLLHGAQGDPIGAAVYLALQGLILSGAVLWRQLGRKVVWTPSRED